MGSQPHSVHQPNHFLKWESEDRDVLLLQDARRSSLALLERFAPPNVCWRWTTRLAVAGTPSEHCEVVSDRVPIA